MRGDGSGCASPLLTPTPHQLYMNISSGDIGLQQQYGVEMQLHHLSSPLPSFHPSIPHTFHVVIEYGLLPVPWITFPPGSLFFIICWTDLPLSFSTPVTLSFIYFSHLFFLSFISSSLCTSHRFTLSLSLSIPLYLIHFLSTLCTGGVIGAPLSPILWFLKALLPHRGEKVTASSFFDFLTWF